MSRWASSDTEVLLVDMNNFFKFLHFQDFHQGQRVSSVDAQNKLNSKFNWKFDRFADAPAGQRNKQPINCDIRYPRGRRKTRSQQTHNKWNSTHKSNRDEKFCITTERTHAMLGMCNLPRHWKFSYFFLKNHFVRQMICSGTLGDGMEFGDFTSFCPFCRPVLWLPPSWRPWPHSAMTEWTKMKMPNIVNVKFNSRHRLWA